MAVNDTRVMPAYWRRRPTTPWAAHNRRLVDFSSGNGHAARRHRSAGDGGVDNWLEVVRLSMLGRAPGLSPFLDAMEQAVPGRLWDRRQPGLDRAAVPELVFSNCLRLRRSRTADAAATGLRSSADSQRTTRSSSRSLRCSAGGSASWLSGPVPLARAAVIPAGVALLVNVLYHGEHDAVPVVFLGGTAHRDSGGAGATRPAGRWRAGARRLPGF